MVAHIIVESRERHRRAFTALLKPHSLMKANPVERSTNNSNLRRISSVGTSSLERPCCCRASVQTNPSSYSKHECC
jgi:hypothetical protein